MTKAILTLALILMTVFNASSQTVTIQELLDKSKCKDFTCYNDFIIQKGFSYFKSDTETGGKWYLYLSDKKSPTSSTPSVSTSNTSIITFNSDGSTTAGFRTAIIEQYRSIMTQIKTLGFTAASTKNIDNGVVVKYTSVKYPKVQIAVQTDKIGDSSTWTSYDISINRFF